MIFADSACFRLFSVVLQSCSIEFVLRYTSLFWFFRSFSSAGTSAGKWVAKKISTRNSENFAILSWIFCANFAWSRRRTRTYSDPASLSTSGWVFYCGPIIQEFSAEVPALEMYFNSDFDPPILTLYRCIFERRHSIFFADSACFRAFPKSRKSAPRAPPNSSLAPLESARTESNY